MGGGYRPPQCWGPSPTPQFQLHSACWRLGGAHRPLPPPQAWHCPSLPPPQATSALGPPVPKEALSAAGGRRGGSAAHSALGGLWLSPHWASVSPSASPLGLSSAKNTAAAALLLSGCSETLGFAQATSRPPCPGASSLHPACGLAHPLPPRPAACPPQLLSRDPNPCSINGFSSAKPGLPSCPPSTLPLGLNETLHLL